MNGERLVQFQCGREGTLFYYQSSMIQVLFVDHCPVCGSKRVLITGREYPAVDENRPIRKRKAA